MAAMSIQRFMLLLAVVAGGVTALHLLLQQTVHILKPHGAIGLWYVYMYVFLSLVQFFLGQKAVQHPRKNWFNNIIIGSVFFKMLLAMVVLVTYKMVYKPTGTAYLIPFLWIYVVFTVFEVYFMLKLTQKPVRPLA